MAGAYSAREPAAAADPGYPPGWPSYPWPFPGPYPPGYTPMLSFITTAPFTLVYNEAASITGSARDQDTYATNEPSAITWTATIAETPVDLRFSGDPSYSSSIESSVTFGTYWGATPSIEFDLTEDNVDDVVVLRGVYTLDGIQVANIESIEIVAARYLVVLTAILSAGYSYGWAGHVRVRANLERDSDGDRTLGEILYQDGLPDIEQSTDELDEASVETVATGQDVGGDSVVVTSTGLNENEIYNIVGQVDGYRPDASGTARILIIEEISSTVIYDHTSDLAVSHPLNHVTDAHRVELDTSDGSYTVITS